MFDGPWFTCRSPRPIAATAAASRWIGFGSSSTTAISRSESGSLWSKRHGPSASPSFSSGMREVPSRDHPGLRAHERLVSLRVGEAQGELEQVEDAGAAALLADEPGELAGDLVRLADAQRLAVVEREGCHHWTVVRGRVDDVPDVLDAV